MWTILVGLLSSYLASTVVSFEYIDEFRMPNVTATEDDAYLCYARATGQMRRYITHFKPLRSDVTHHMIIFACEYPGSFNYLWNCGESDESKPVCKGKSRILFSWAMNARDFNLPPNVSIPIGGQEYNYLVLQVHYKDASGFERLPNSSDQSGWALKVQTEPTRFLAGVYTFIADGEIKPYGTTIVQMTCRYTGLAEIHPFAFRVHAHSHGVVNDAYVIHDGTKSLIGSKSPQEEQTFYPVENKSLVILPDDVLFARCKMYNDEGRVITMGHTRKHEMCNFYMMYAVHGSDAAQLFDPENQDCAPYQVSKYMDSQRRGKSQTLFNDFGWGFGQQWSDYPRQISNADEYDENDDELGEI